MASSNAYARDESRYKELVKCIFCRQSEKALKFLDCPHSACKKCLKGMGRSVQCTACFQPTELKTSGTMANNFLRDQIEVLTVMKKMRPCKLCTSFGKDNASTHNCLECQGEPLCEKCVQIHAKMVATRTHVPVPLDKVLDTFEGIVCGVDQNHPAAICPKHKNEILTSFCATCKVLTCSVCLEQHESTTCSKVELSAVSIEIRNDLTTKLTQGESDVSHITSVANAYESYIDDLETETDSVTKTIRERARELIRGITNISCSLTEQLKVACREEVVSSSVKLQTLQHLRTYARDTLVLTNMVNRISSDTEIIARQAFVSSRLRNMHHFAEQATSLAHSTQTRTAFYSPGKAETLQHLEWLFGETSRTLENGEASQVKQPPPAVIPMSEGTNSSTTERKLVGASDAHNYTDSILLAPSSSGQEASNMSAMGMCVRPKEVATNNNRQISVSEVKSAPITYSASASEQAACGVKIETQQNDIPKGVRSTVETKDAKSFFQEMQSGEKATMTKAVFSEQARNMSGHLMNIKGELPEVEKCTIPKLQPEFSHSNQNIFVPSDAPRVVPLCGTKVEPRRPFFCPMEIRNSGWNLNNNCTPIRAMTNNPKTIATKTKKLKSPDSIRGEQLGLDVHVPDHSNDLNDDSSSDNQSETKSPKATTTEKMDSTSRKGVLSENPKPSVVQVNVASNRPPSGCSNEKTFQNTTTVAQTGISSNQSTVSSSHATTENSGFPSTPAFMVHRGTTKTKEPEVKQSLNIKTPAKKCVATALVPPKLHEDNTVHAAREVSKIPSPSSGVGRKDSENAVAPIVQDKRDGPVAPMGKPSPECLDDRGDQKKKSMARQQLPNSEDASTSDKKGPAEHSIGNSRLTEQSMISSQKEVPLDSRGSSTNDASSSSRGPDEMDREKKRISEAQPLTKDVPHAPVEAASRAISAEEALNLQLKMLPYRNVAQSEKGSSESKEVSQSKTCGGVKMNPIEGKTRNEKEECDRDKRLEMTSSCTGTSKGTVAAEVDKFRKCAESNAGDICGPNGMEKTIVHVDNSLSGTTSESSASDIRGADGIGKTDIHIDHHLNENTPIETVIDMDSGTVSVVTLVEGKRNTQEKRSCAPSREGEQDGDTNHVSVRNPPEEAPKMAQAGNRSRVIKEYVMKRVKKPVKIPHAQTSTASRQTSIAEEQASKINANAHTSFISLVRRPMGSASHTLHIAGRLSTTVAQGQGLEDESGTSRFRVSHSVPDFFVENTVTGNLRRTVSDDQLYKDEGNANNNPTKALFKALGISNNPSSPLDTDTKVNAITPRDLGEGHPCLSADGGDHEVPLFGLTPACFIAPNQSTPKRNKIRQEEEVPSSSRCDEPASQNASGNKRCNITGPDTSTCAPPDGKSGKSKSQSGASDESCTDNAAKAGSSSVAADWASQSATEEMVQDCSQPDTHGHNTDVTCGEGMPAQSHPDCKTQVCKDATVRLSVGLKEADDIDLKCSRDTAVQGHPDIAGNLNSKNPERLSPDEKLDDAVASDAVRSGPHSYTCAIGAASTASSGLDSIEPKNVHQEKAPEYSEKDTSRQVHDVKDKAAIPPITTKSDATETIPAEERMKVKLKSCSSGKAFVQTRESCQQTAAPTPVHKNKDDADCDSKRTVKYSPDKKQGGTRFITTNKDSSSSLLTFPLIVSLYHARGRRSSRTECVANLTFSEFDYVSGCAINQDGEVLISGPVAYDAPSCISIVGLDGRRRYPIYYEVKSPWDLVAHGTNIYLIDYDQNCVLQISRHGELIKQYAFPPAENQLTAKIAHGIAVSESGMLFLCSINTNMVYYYNEEDECFLAAPVGDLYEPTCMRVSPNGDLIVSCHESIVAFKPSWDTRFVYGHTPSSPWGIHVDSKAQIYVADHKKHLVLVLSGKGQYLCTLLTGNRDPIAWPHTIAMSARERHMVVAHSSNKLAIFRSSR